LHDSTVQHLVAASLLLTTLKARSATRDESLWNDLEQVLGEAMKELRTFSYLMHPPTLHAVGLFTSLQRYVEGFAERSRLPVKLRVSGACQNLSLGVQRSIFRIVQEGLSNAYRHACASALSVQLRHIGGRLHIIITDNGTGLDAEQKPGERSPRRLGVGIRGIEMRVKRVGGWLRLGRPLGGGTRLHAVLPVDAQAE
jgi:signal transduction histidine kinase